MDWTTGSWQAQPEPVTAEASVLIAGDWAPIRRYGPLIEASPASIYGDLLPHIQQADLRIVNLEAVLCEQGQPIAKQGPNLRGEPTTVSGLSVVPFDVACLANNHILDYGEQALERTLSLLDGHQIQTVGAGLTRTRALEPLVCQVNQMRIGIVNFCEGEDGTASTEGAGTFGWEPDTVIQTIMALRETVDLVIVIAHVGREFAAVPPPYVHRVFRNLARAGAHLVIGHHPHVPQGMEIFEGVPICYSLGNFVFDQEGSRFGSVFQRLGYMVSVELAAQRLSGIRLLPYGLTRQGLRSLTDDEKAWLFERLEQASRPLQDPALVREAWYGFIDSFSERHWIERAGGMQPAVGRLADDHTAALADMRNLLIAPAHEHFLADGFSRAIRNELGKSQPWAQELARQWRKSWGIRLEPGVPAE